MGNWGNFAGQFLGGQCVTLDQSIIKSLSIYIMQKKTRGRRTFPNFVGIIKTVTCGVNNKIVRPVSGMLRAFTLLSESCTDTRNRNSSRLTLKSVGCFSQSRLKRLCSRLVCRYMIKLQRVFVLRARVVM